MNQEGTQYRSHYDEIQAEQYRASPELHCLRNCEARLHAHDQRFAETTNQEQTANGTRHTANREPQTVNGKGRTAKENSENGKNGENSTNGEGGKRLANGERRTANSERRTANDASTSQSQSVFIDFCQSSTTSSLSF